MDRQLNITLPLTRNYTAIAALIIVISIGAFWADTLRLQEGPASEGDSSPRTVAWYVAHIAEAKAVNRTCFHSQETATTQSSEACQNAFRALELAHVSVTVHGFYAA